MTLRSKGLNVFETGLSNFHKMAVTVMKMSNRSLRKLKKKVKYGKYKDISNDRFKEVFS